MATISFINPAMRGGRGLSLATSKLYHAVKWIAIENR